MKTNCFSCLSVDCLRVISLFLTHNDCRKVLYSSHTLESFKFEVCYWNLNNYYSLQYYKNESYRSLVNSKVKNVSIQLSLKFDGEIPASITSFELFSKIHSLTFRKYQFTSFSFQSSSLPYKVNLSFCPNLTDVSALKNVKDLNLSYCTSLEDVGMLKGEDEWWDPPRARTLLTGIHKLNLAGCSSIKDISSLRNIHTLILRDCKGISDFSSLGNHYYLDVSHTKIDNVCNLGKVHVLYLEDTLVKEVSALKDVHTINLFSQREIEDVSALENVSYLDLRITFFMPSFALKYEGFSPHWKLKKLLLPDIPEAVNINLFCFQNVIELFFTSLPSYITEIDCLVNVQKLCIWCSNELQKIRNLTNLRQLSVSRCPKLICISRLDKLFKLSVISCENLKEISFVDNLTILRLHYCFKFNDLSYYPNLESLCVNIGKQETMNKMKGLLTLSKLKYLNYSPKSHEIFDNPVSIEKFIKFIDKLETPPYGTFDITIGFPDETNK
jgi:hypothetical protein